jgi:Zn2+/Cd2+-exporting ATPase
MPGDKPTSTETGATCIVRSVASALASDPSLEAVTIDRGQKTISVATLGKVDEERIAHQISERVREAESVAVEQQCTLLSGEPDCNSCKIPLTASERKALTITRQGASTTIARVTCPTAPKFWRWRKLPWPRVVQRDVEFLEHIEEVEEWKPQLTAALSCGGFGLAGYFLQPDSFATAFYAAAYLSGAWYTAQEVWERLQKRAIDVHFLMLAVAVGSAAIGAWAEGAMLLFLFSLSGALEHFALGRTQREIRSLFREAPKTATVVDNGNERELPVDALAKGMRLRIRPGAQFPVDAEVLSGQSAADESNLTGEATPVEKSAGDHVLAGTLNLWGAVEVAVLRPASESALQRIITLIREAQHQKAPAQQFTDKFGTTYTYAVLSLTVVMFFVWWLGFGLPPFTSATHSASAFYRTMTLLVVASPCALVLSIPSAVLAAIAWSARHGILFRGGAAVEKLAGIDIVAMDKTGTLTTGELKVETIESFPPGREKEVAEIACSLEQHSAHPLARAINRYAKQNTIPLGELTRFESITGQGLRGWRHGQVCRLGRRDWIVTDAGTRGASTSSLQGVRAPAISQSVTNPGVSEVWVNEGDLLGRLTLRDDIRPQARAVVESLKGLGLKTVVLTGDRPATGEYLQRELQVDNVRTQLTPEQKVEAIGALRDSVHRVAMIGDGVNDAPSLAAADIGVAMGARGADAALEQADVVLMHDRLENFLAAYRLSHRARRIIRQNLVISLGTVVFLVAFAFAGKIPLTVGVVGHEGSTVVVVMNSLRLLFGRAKPGTDK